MTKSVEQLVMTLNKEAEIYSEILDVAQRKRSAIKQQKISELEMLTTEEQGLVVSLFKLEEIREKVVDIIMRENKIEFVENVTQLTQFLPQESKSAVLGAKDRLLVLVKNVSDENRFNSKLLEEKINLLNFSLDLITQIDGDTSKYNKDAVDDSGERRSIFDARV